MEAVLNKEVITNKVVCRIFAVLASITMMALGAYVRLPLPFTPVPVTLQTFFVLLCAALLGRGLGTWATAGYALLGASGLSMFSGTSSGASYFMGPTGGYIIGFILAGVVLGKALKYAGRNNLGVFAAFCLADLVILLSGTLWLKALLNVSILEAMRLGFVPFIPGDMVKIIAAVAAFRGLNRRAGAVL